MLRLTRVMELAGKMAMKKMVVVDSRKGLRGCDRVVGRFWFADEKNLSSKAQVQQQNVVETDKKKNSIDPKFEEGYAYGHFFPVEWDEKKILQILDPSGKNVEKLTFVKTKVGEKSHKILIKFKNQQIRNKYIAKYHEDYIITNQQTQRVAILPFELKTQIRKKQAKQGLIFRYGVRVSNLDFDIDEKQMRKLASDYGELSHIEMYQRLSGINRGFATVYFLQSSSAEAFQKFVDGFIYRQRRLKAHLMKPPQKKNQKQLLEVPSYTFNANIELMKKIKSKQYEHTS